MTLGLRETLIDLASAAADATGDYANVALTPVNDHVVRMSVMTGPFYWHRHPNSDETFLVVEGTVLLETERGRAELGEGQMFTVPAGLAHVTRPLTPRSVNITIERRDMETEKVDPPSD